MIILQALACDFNILCDIIFLYDIYYVKPSGNNKLYFLLHTFHWKIRGSVISLTAYEREDHYNNYHQRLTRKSVLHFAV